MRMRYLALIGAMAWAAAVRADEVKYPDLPAAFSSFGAAVADDYVYVYGGHTGKAHSYSVETTQGEFRRLSLKKPEKWEELQDFITANHSYEVPEIVAIDVAKFSHPYLDWAKNALS